MLKNHIPSTIPWEAVQDSLARRGILDYRGRCAVPPMNPEKFRWMNIAFFPGHGCRYLLPRVGGANMPADSEWVQFLQPPHSEDVYLPLAPLDFHHTISQRDFQGREAAMGKSIREFLTDTCIDYLDRNFVLGLRSFVDEPAAVTPADMIPYGFRILQDKRDRLNKPLFHGSHTLASYNAYAKILAHSLEPFNSLGEMVVRGPIDTVGTWTYVFGPKDELTSTLYMTPPRFEEVFINPSDEFPDIQPLVKHSLTVDVGIMLDPSDWVTLQQARSARSFSRSCSRVSRRA
jgi:hypothetical protein